MKKIFIKDLVYYTDLSRATIRYYEEFGLISPAKRNENGYKLYDAVTLKQLKLISKLKELRFKLKEIKGILWNPYRMNRFHVTK